MTVGQQRSDSHRRWDVDLSRSLYCPPPGSFSRKRLSGNARREGVHRKRCTSYETAPRMLAIPEVRELNIGHFLIGESIFIGLDAAIRRMRAAMDAA